jgi:S-adenosylmethionine:tRNA ribosyltransferase-isomerase
VSKTAAVRQSSSGSLPDAAETLRTADFDYFLPEKLIAQTPTKKRDNSRLLVLERGGGKISHHRFFEIEKFLRPGDLLILNDTKVVPARLTGIKDGGSAKIDVLLLQETKKNIWKCLVRPGKRLKVGARVIFAKGKMTATVLAKSADGGQFLQFAVGRGSGFYRQRERGARPNVVKQLIEKLGKVPLPPYIKTTTAVSAKSFLGKRYQTVFAQKDGATAAPTAGLHFTRPLLSRLKKKGIKIAYLTLHTGLGTFRPVYAEYIRDHQMHSEYFEIGRECAAAIRACRGRIIAVGTTVVRALETWGRRMPRGQLKPCFGETDLFIYPGFKFKLVDALVTNFHFPRSSLLMLAAALVEEKSRAAGIKGLGRDLLFAAYEEAKRRHYRFFSFGDAMLIM